MCGPYASELSESQSLQLTLFLTPNRFHVSFSTAGLVSHDFSFTSNSQNSSESENEYGDYNHTLTEKIALQCIFLLSVHKPLLKLNSPAGSINLLAHLWLLRFIGNTEFTSFFICRILLEFVLHLS